MFVRTADRTDALEVRRILDGAMLEPGDVEARIGADDVLVAGDYRGSSGDQTPDRPTAGERLLGTVVLEPCEDGAHVSAIGVRRRHRGRGIGTALIERALERERRLTARFDDGVRPFYDALGFAVEPIDDQRYRGVLTVDDHDADG
ncbi:GNAT family N-acetyltransferase [Halopiger goleimassiliensis]|uniref:GNAT family N-acetyltransferase n=1 Tax=Halopiger goleimassiliensis TaxID=1293048 RepID=UPI0006777830|nr:GNAT family N-acetyltransferase [Halopiger goleimassiliensis]